VDLFGNERLFWFILGFAFLIVEVLAPGVFFLFFGIGAWVVMLLLLVLPVPQVAQWIIFVAVSVIGLVILRRHVALLFKRRHEGRRDSLQEPMVAEGYIGRVVEVVADITPERPGMVELNGTNWQARSAVGLVKGTMARVKEVNGLTLEVEPQAAAD
jgi:membrane protein implicated in regulation of membrane protease activity